MAPGGENMFIEPNAIDTPRVYYEHVVRNTLLILWKHRLLVVRVLGVALAVCLIAVTFMAPRYTGEAIIQLDFVRTEGVAGEKVLSTAAVDAAAVVDSAARIIRSRGTASAVVSALTLENEPGYANQSLPSRALSSVWSIFGRPVPTPRDLAVSRLMDQITVTNDPRSYLITVGVTTSDPVRAARLANWVASEYLRGRLREQTTEAYAAAEREIAALSAVVGPRHPTYLGALAKLEHMKEALDVGRKGIAAVEREAVITPDMVRFAAGQSMLPAEVTMVPSGPNVVLLFVLTILAALAMGVVLSLLIERRMFRWPRGLAETLRTDRPAFGILLRWYPLKWYPRMRRQSN